MSDKIPLTADFSGSVVVSLREMGAAETIPPANLAPEAVIAPSLINSWANIGAPYRNAGYWKDGFGMVHLQGAIKTGAGNTVAFILPAGYRPSATVALAPSYKVGQNGSTCWVTIDSSGNVTCGQGGSTGTGLDGLSFRV